MRFLKEAGYDGYSMSNNARSAYEQGEKPLSKWTKEAVINQIAYEMGVSPDDIVLLKNWKDYLVKSSWHHTSKFYNKTNFYSVDFDESEIALRDEAKEKIKQERVTKLEKRINELDDELKELNALVPEADIEIKEDGIYKYITLPKEYPKSNYIFLKDISNEQILKVIKTKLDLQKASIQKYRNNAENDLIELKKSL